MFVRKSLAGVLATTVVGATIALTAGAASAASYNAGPNDSKTSGITATDLVGVGSDTSEHALKLLADAWNQGARDDYGQTFDVATFGAIGGNSAVQDDLPSPITVDSTTNPLVRPNGSGPGRATLFGTGRASNVDFARSSSSPSAQNFTDGMRVIPFALDTVVPAISGSNPVAASNPTLTLQQLRDIYVTCTTTNWHQIDATFPSEPIHPYTPKQGSGTESFFKSNVLPVGTTVYGACVKDHTGPDATPVPVQEHDPGLFAIDPDAIVPFSKGRAELAGSAVKVVGGSEVAFRRNLYNVVRVDEANHTDIQSFFGKDGFVCSAAAHDLIAAAGFQQLATVDLGGDCGKVLNTASSNFTTNTVTTPTVAVSAAGTPGHVNLTATVSSTPSAIGTVTFKEGATVLAANVSIVSGRAVTSPLNLAVGSHSITATFNPGQANFAGTEMTQNVVVKSVTTASETFPATVHLRKAKAVAVKGSVSIKGGSTATGRVTIKKGSKVIKSGTLKAGKVSLTLPKMKKGTYKLTIVYPGDANHLAVSKTFTIKVVK